MHALDALGNPIRRDILTALRRAPMPWARWPNASRSAARLSRGTCGCSKTRGWSRPEERGTQNLYAVRVQGFRAVREYIDSFWDVALSRLEELARQ